MDKEEEFLTKLANRTVEYFSENLQIEVKQYFDIVDVDTVDFDDVTSMIALSNGLDAVVGMSVSEGLSAELLKLVLPFEIENKEEKTELEISNIAEILNTTLGNILNDFSADGKEVSISPPKVLQKKIEILKKKNGKMKICILQYKNEAITLFLFL